MTSWDYGLPETTPYTQAQLRDLVPCPSCGASIGAYCKSKSDRPSNAHVARTRQGNRVADELFWIRLKQLRSEYAVAT